MPSPQVVLRGERIQLLVEAAEELEASANQFRKQVGVAMRGPLSKGGCDSGASCRRSARSRAGRAIPWLLWSV
jgi:hypothetical protein